METHYTVQQAADLLHRDVATIRRYIHSGLLAATLPVAHGHYLIPASALESFTLNAYRTPVEAQGEVSKG